MSDAITPASPTRPEYAEAAAWAAEVHGALRASRRTAWLAAGGATLAAALLGVALSTVGPIRSAAPYLVPVDRQAGGAQAVRRLAPGALVRDPAMIDGFLATYVIARESFDASRLQARYQSVALWSDPGERARYAAEITRANPASPVATFGPGTVVEVVVKSVSPLSPTQALVRFDTLRRDPGLPTTEQRGWQATLTYKADAEPLRNLERYSNPLGFRVADYERSPDGSLSVQVAPFP